MQGHSFKNNCKSSYLIRVAPGHRESASDSGQSGRLRRGWYHDGGAMTLQAWQNSLDRCIKGGQRGREGGEAMFVLSVHGDEKREGGKVNMGHSSGLRHVLLSGWKRKCWGFKGPFLLYSHPFFPIIDLMRCGLHCLLLWSAVYLWLKTCLGLNAVDSFLLSSSAMLHTQTCSSSQFVILLDPSHGLYFSSTSNDTMLLKMLSLYYSGHV